MRLSVRKDDPGYSPTAFRARVSVDGVEITNCFTADEERGEAFVYVVDDRGVPVWNAMRTGVEEMVLRGNVRIRFDDLQ